MLEPILEFAFYIFWSLITAMILTQFTIFYLKMTKKDYAAQKIQRKYNHYTKYLKS